MRFSNYLFNRKLLCNWEMHIWIYEYRLWCASRLNLGVDVVPDIFQRLQEMSAIFTSFEFCRWHCCLCHGEIQWYDQVPTEGRPEADVNLLSSKSVSNQLEKGKTGTMLFGTAKRLTKCGKKLTLYYDGIQMQTAGTYKYLGTTLDSTLSLSTNFKKMYKKTTAKLCMMYSLHSYLDQHSKIKTFCGTILPCITYNCTVNMDLNLTQIKKLQTIDIFTTNVTGTRQPSVENEIKKRLIILVQKCVGKDTCKNFKDYF